MKTHIIKHNRILKSFESAFIVLTMSFITFYILQSLVSLSGLLHRPEASPSSQTELATINQKPGHAVFVNPVRGTSTVGPLVADKGHLAVKTSQVTSTLFSIDKYIEPAMEERLHLMGWMVDPLLWFPGSIKVMDNASGYERQVVEISGNQVSMPGALRANYAFSEEAEPPLKLEAWMVDADVFAIIATKVKGEL